ncbi:hypothetical protein PHMEG_0006020 [Phytophthora megakarya]|uniref:Tf2-1-like SH3-like domain-containing protein n=1 Tax=Phytophthora megakarya TaxID=4795 RepID=A0A225WPY5_9STRA|nr:hypothetical protein PHMEG_0006020 [Phytophthora megakarya]
MIEKPRFPEWISDAPECFQNIVTEDSNETSVGEAKSLFKDGDRIRLYMERVKPGLSKKLAHQWHGPFRVKEKVQEFAYELDLPDRSAYS